MKKIISLLMVVAMVCLAVASCGVTTPTTGGTQGTQDGTQGGTPVATPAPAVTIDPSLPVDPTYGLNGETPTDLAVFKTQTLADGTVKIKGVYTEGTTLKKIVIPAVVDGKKVSVIGESALAKCEVEELVVSGYVTKIEPYAFSDCAKLKTVVFPEFVSELGEGAFSGCKAITDLSFLPEKALVKVGARAFVDCENLKTAILPDTIASIGGFTFMGCKRLAEVKLPVAMTAIPERMFMGCQELLNTTGSDGVVIPAGVKTIGELAFYECQKVAKFVLPEGLETISKQAFDTCRRMETLVIPNSVKTIGDKAFNTCQKLTTVTMPSGADVKLGETLFTDAKKIETFNVTAGSAAETYCNEWKAVVDADKNYKVKPVVNVIG